MSVTVEKFLYMFLRSFYSNTFVLVNEDGLFYIISMSGFPSLRTIHISHIYHISFSSTLTSLHTPIYFSPHLFLSLCSNFDSVADGNTKMFPSVSAIYHGFNFVVHYKQLPRFY